MEKLLLRRLRRRLLLLLVLSVVLLLMRMRWLVRRRRRLLWLLLRLLLWFRLGLWRPLLLAMLLAWIGPVYRRAAARTRCGSPCSRPRRSSARWAGPSAA
jgi:hypothetical protein